MRKEVLAVAVFIFIISFISSAEGDCVSNWSCTDWGECVGENQIRVCVDTNFCENSTKPEEIRSCGVDCDPDWKCSQWLPLLCPDSNTQTRQCLDLNECGNLENMPESAKECSKNFAWLIIFIIFILVILIIGDLGILKEKLSKKRLSN